LKTTVAFGNLSHREVTMGEGADVKTKKPSEAMAVVMLLWPLAGVALIWLWIANRGLDEAPMQSLLLVVVVVIGGTALLAAADAARLEMAPPIWFALVALLWVVGYPLFLFRRSRRGAKNFVFNGVVCMLAFAGSAAAMASRLQTRLVGYEHAMKKIEGRMNVRTLAEAAAAYYQDKKQFPPSAPLTPAKSCCEQGGRCLPADKNWAGETWTALRFSVDVPHYFQYEFVSSGTGSDATFKVRAVTELDCDGKKSFFERSGRVTEDGNVYLGEMDTEEGPSLWP
jgi:hypothetical protein